MVTITKTMIEARLTVLEKENETLRAELADAVTVHTSFLAQRREEFVVLADFLSRVVTWYGESESETDTLLTYIDDALHSETKPDKAPSVD